MRILSMPIHMSFDPNLYDLINNQDRKNDEYSDLSFRE